MLIPLAHGVFGIWDEIIPVALVGAFILILVVAGWMARREEAKLDKQTAQQDAGQEMGPADTAKAEGMTPVTQAKTAADHYRLD